MGKVDPAKTLTRLADLENQKKTDGSAEHNVEVEPPGSVGGEKQHRASAQRQRWASESPPRPQAGAEQEDEKGA